MTPAERKELWRRMRTPTFTFLALLALLGVNVLLGDLMPFHSVWVLELAIAVVMVAVVLLFSMEVWREPPLMRLFSIVGFCWLGILFGMTLVDYLSRANHGG